MTCQRLKILICSTLAIALFASCPTDTNAQHRRKTQRERDGIPVKGRPDRRAIDASPQNILPKFSELRHFNTSGTEEYRTLNGTFNNLTNPRLGSIFVDLVRMAPAAYGPNNALARGDMPSPRLISNTIAAQNQAIPNSRNLTDMVWQWGQFMDHDLSLTEFHQFPVEPVNIPVPLGDPIFDPTGLGFQTIGFNRSLHRRRVYIFSPVRQQLNEITAWIDASNVYGSEEEDAEELRSHVNGKLLTSDEAGLFLPIDPPVGNGNPQFIAGDVRSTEQVGLACMHTIFMREHNRLCDEIIAADPTLTDEEIYQMARKEVYSILESITYNEWLPALLGPDNLLPEYAGYDQTVNPNIANEFSTAAFRFGHTMLNNQLLRLSDNGFPSAAPILLRDAFFDADVLTDFGVEPYLKGLMTQIAQETDAKFINAVRNFLFANAPGATQGPAGPIGLDLAALNFQRGRDHGLPGINSIRIAMGLQPFDSYSDFISDPLTIAQFQAMYGADVNDADPMIAMLAENHASNSSLGSTMIAVISDQFQRLRDGDRFWYQNILEGEDLERINNTTLADIIKRNTNLVNVPDNVFVGE